MFLFRLVAQGRFRPMQVRAGNVKMYHHLLRRMTLVKWVYGAVALTELPLEQFDTFCRPGAAL